MKEYYSIQFPFGKIPQGSKIVFYGAGDVGQTLYWQVRNTNYCEVVGWVDSKWEEVPDLPPLLWRKGDLLKREFDILLIAVKSQQAVREITEGLLTAGVPKKKILAVELLFSYALCGQGNGSGEEFTKVFCECLQIEGGRNNWPPESARESEVIEESSKLHIGMGFLTAGNMAGIMADTVNKRIENVSLEAVASRELRKAERFADKYHVKRAYGSYEELVYDPEVELVHVASPAGLHYEHVMLCLKAGKHVLCEKPFAVSAAQAKEMLALAQEKHLLLADGLWTSYLPMARKVKETVESGVIGKICTLTANSHYFSIHSPRINNRELGGGVLGENGIYLLGFATLVLGYDVQRVEASGIVNTEGVDIQDTITLYYPNDQVAVLNCSIQGVSDRRGYIYGDQGYIEVQDANEYRKILVYDKGGTLISKQEMDGGYQYEVLDCIRAMKEGNSQCEARNHREILKTMELLDKIRERIGGSIG